MNAARRPLIDEGALESFEATGMRPPSQARSLRLLVRLFNEGLALLDETDFEGLSIEVLCLRAGNTVGAFYSRFENKEAFVEALQRLVVSQTRARIVDDYESGAPPDDDLSALLYWISKGAVAWYRRYEGLVRASLRRASGKAETWTPMRELGELQIAYALPRILALAPAPRESETEERARLAFQMLFGALNNMVLINPGPFTIHDRRTAQMLASAITASIRAAPGG